MMKIGDCIIDWEKTLGINPKNGLMAVGIKEAFAWEDGKKTKKVEGWNIECLIPRLQFEKVAIKVLVDGDKPFRLEEGETVEVKFVGLKGKAYMDYQSNQVKFAITADSIQVISEA